MMFMLLFLALFLDALMGGSGIELGEDKRKFIADKHKVNERINKNFNVYFGGEYAAI